MVSNATLETINYAKDLDIEYNTKIILLFTLLAYAVVMFYLSFKMEDKNLWQLLLKQIVMRWSTLPYIVLFFIPMLMVYRGVALESIFILIWQGYIVLFVILSLLFVVFGFEWVASFFGIKNMGEIIKAGINRRFKQ